MSVFTTKKFLKKIEVWLLKTLFELWFSYVNEKLKNVKTLSLWNANTNSKFVKQPFSVYPELLIRKLLWKSIKTNVTTPSTTFGVIWKNVQKMCCLSKIKTRQKILNVYTIVLDRFFQNSRPPNHYHHRPSLTILFYWNKNTISKMLLKKKILW